MSDLYRIDADWTKRTPWAVDTLAGLADLGVLVLVERCEHGFLEEHDFFVAKVDERGRKYEAVEWCVGSPTLEDDE